jgi:xanthine/uracil permease
LSIETVIVVLICGLIAFLVSYALLVETAELKRERSFFAGTIVALTVILIAAALARPVIGKWASAVDQTRHVRPLAEEQKLN